MRQYDSDHKTVKGRLYQISGKYRFIYTSPASPSVSTSCSSEPFCTPCHHTQHLGRVTLLLNQAGTGYLLHNDCWVVLNLLSVLWLFKGLLSFTLPVNLFFKLRIQLALSLLQGTVEKTRSSPRKTN